MELKEFVTATLVEIQEGVQAAINKTMSGGTNGVINPSWGSANEIGADHIERVNFDIAVTVSDKTAGGVQAGIKVIGVKLGGEGSVESESSNVSRIQFSIRVIQPVTTVTPSTAGSFE